MSDAELIDIVDANDGVVGQATRDEINERRLRHRIVHVLLYQPDGRLVLQQRSARKSYLPLVWTTSAGGYVQAGESYLEGAMRELEEELGLRVPLAFVRWYMYTVPEAPGFVKHTAVFHAESPEAPKPHPDEVERIQAFSQAELSRLLEDADVHAELREALIATSPFITHQ